MAASPPPGCRFKRSADELQSTIACLTSAHNPGERSHGPCWMTTAKLSSQLLQSTKASAAAAMAGDRLIPAPQQTSVGTRQRSKVAEVSIARRSNQASLPAPSLRGKRQFVKSRVIVAGGSLAARSTSALMPAEWTPRRSRASPTWPSHNEFPAIRRMLARLLCCVCSVSIAWIERYL